MSFPKRGIVMSLSGLFMTVCAIYGGHYAAAGYGWMSDANLWTAILFGIIGVSFVFAGAAFAVEVELKKDEEDKT